MVDTATVRLLWLGTLSIAALVLEVRNIGLLCCPFLCCKIADRLAPRSRRKKGCRAAQESAELLLEPKHENVAPWFQIWWDALPTKADFLWRRQPFPTDKLALLQDEALVHALP